MEWILIEGLFPKNDMIYSVFSYLSLLHIGIHGIFEYS